MVFVVHWIKYPYDLEYETIGEFSSMDELLKDLKIKGRPFSEIITDPKTRIDCRDDEVDYLDLLFLSKSKELKQKKCDCIKRKAWLL